MIKISNILIFDKIVFKLTKLLVFVAGTKIIVLIMPHTNAYVVSHAHTLSRADQECLSK